MFQFCFPKNSGVYRFLSEKQNGVCGKLLAGLSKPYFACPVRQFVEKKILKTFFLFFLSNFGQQILSRVVKIDSKYPEEICVSTFPSEVSRVSWSLTEIFQGVCEKMSARLSEALFACPDTHDIEK